MMASDRWIRPRRGSGSLLVLFLIALIVLPLWYWRGRSHRLAGETRVDLCRRLDALPGLAGLQSAPFAAGDVAGSCRWSAGPQRVVLEASLITTRGSGGHDVGRQFDAWREEIKASYGPTASLRQIGDENLRTLSWRSPGGNDRFVEDHGIALSLHSQTLDDTQLDALIDPAREALRRDPQGR